MEKKPETKQPKAVFFFLFLMHVDSFIPQPMTHHTVYSSGNNGVKHGGQTIKWMGSSFSRVLKRITG